MFFAISALGILSDFISTIIGVSNGYYEIHPKYSPIWAIMIFWSLITITRLLPKSKFTNTFRLIISIAPFIGTINNSLVLFGLFRGITF